MVQTTKTCGFFPVYQKKIGGGGRGGACWMRWVPLYTLLHAVHEEIARIFFFLFSHNKYYIVELFSVGMV